MMSLPGEFPPGDRFYDSRKGRMWGGGWVHSKGENGQEAYMLGAERGTCHVFSMNECTCSASQLHVQGCFLCQSALTLSERKPVRKWACRITANILAMPEPILLCAFWSLRNPQDLRYGHSEVENQD